MQAVNIAKAQIRNEIENYIRDTEQFGSFAAAAAKRRKLLVASNLQLASQDPEVRQVVWKSYQTHRNFVDLDLLDALAAIDAHQSADSSRIRRLERTMIHHQAAINFLRTPEEKFLQEQESERYTDIDVDEDFDAEEKAAEAKAANLLGQSWNMLGNFGDFDKPGAVPPSLEDTLPTKEKGPVIEDEAIHPKLLRRIRKPKPKPKPEPKKSDVDEPIVSRGGIDEVDDDLFDEPVRVSQEHAGPPALMETAIMVEEEAPLEDVRAARLLVADNTERAVNALARHFDAESQMELERILNTNFYAAAQAKQAKFDTLANLSLSMVCIGVATLKNDLEFNWFYTSVDSNL